MCRRAAARPKCSSSATAAKYRRSRNSTSTGRAPGSAPGRLKTRCSEPRGWSPPTAPPPGQECNVRRYPGLISHGPTSIGVTAAPRFTFRPSADSCHRADGGRMKIAVLGVGHIGSAVGRLWHSAGRETTLAGRDKREPRDLVAELGARARAATVADALAGADVVLVAVPGPGRDRHADRRGPPRREDRHRRGQHDGPEPAFAPATRRRLPGGPVGTRVATPCRRASWPTRTTACPCGCCSCPATNRPSPPSSSCSRMLDSSRWIWAASKTAVSRTRQRAVEYRPGVRRRQGARGPVPRRARRTR